MIETARCPQSLWMQLTVSTLAGTQKQSNAGTFSKIRDTLREQNIQVNNQILRSFVGKITLQKACLKASANAFLTLIPSEHCEHNG